MKSFLPGMQAITSVRSAIFTALLIAIILVSRTPSYAQQQTGSIKGTVKLQNGTPAKYTSVALKAIHKGTVVNDHGNYLITGVTPGTYFLTATHTGMGSQTQSLTVKAGETLTVDLTMIDTTKALQQVTINSGYNKFAKKETEGIAKMPLQNMENPQVYNVVPKELLQDEAIVSYNDVLKNVAGVSQALVNGSNSFYMRGFLRPATCAMVYRMLKITA